MIRYRRSLNYKRCRLRMSECCISTSFALYEKSKILGSGGSMVVRLKFKGIDGRAHQEWSLRLNLIQYGKTYQVQT